MFTPNHKKFLTMTLKHSSAMYGMLATNNMRPKNKNKNNETKITNKVDQSQQIPKHNTWISYRIKIVQLQGITRTATTRKTYNFSGYNSKQDTTINPRFKPIKNTTY